MSEIKLQVEGEKVIIEERKGTLPDLPPIPKEKAYSFKGVLGCVVDFLSHRQGIINKQLAIVWVDSKSLTIEAQTNPNTDLNDVVTGSIQLNPDLVAFKINKVGNNFSREQLVGFLRTNRQYFPDKEAHGQLLSTIKNLSVKVNIAAGRNEDGRGYRSNNYEKTVESENIPVSCMIEIPVFVGERPIKLSLDICYDTSDSNVYFWFESPELNESIHTESASRMEDEVKKIKDLGYLVLEK